MTANDLAIRAGLKNRAYVGRLEAGNIPPNLRLDYAVRLAAALNVPLSAFAGSEGTWIPVHMSDIERLKPFFDEIAYSDNCLSCTQALDGYLVPAPMFLDFERRRLERGRLSGEEKEKSLREMLEYQTLQAAIRERSNYVHRVLSCAEYFVERFSVDSGWIDPLVEQIQHLREITAVGIIAPEHWLSVDRCVKQLIGYSRWDKIPVHPGEAYLPREKALSSFAVGYLHVYS